MIFNKSVLNVCVDVLESVGVMLTGVGAMLTGVGVTLGGSVTMS